MEKINDRIDEKFIRKAFEKFNDASAYETVLISVEKDFDNDWIARYKMQIEENKNMRLEEAFLCFRETEVANHGAFSAFCKADINKIYSKILAKKFPELSIEFEKNQVIKEIIEVRKELEEVKKRYQKLNLKQTVLERKLKRLEKTKISNNEDYKTMQ